MGVPRVYHYFSGRWPSAATEESVANHVKSFTSVETIRVELLTRSPNSYFRSFHIAIDSKVDSKMYESMNWPLNVEVRRFRISKPKDNLQVSATAVNGAVATTSGIQNKPLHDNV